LKGRPKFAGIEIAALLKSIAAAKTVGDKNQGPLPDDLKDETLTSEPPRAGSDWGSAFLILSSRQYGEKRFKMQGGKKKSIYLQSRK